jgi:uncharacterized protein
VTSLVDDYMEALPEGQRQTAVALREMIFSLVPAVQEKLSFKIPFYHFFGMFCYINAVPGGIDLGLCRGKDLAAEFPSLETKGRAIVATVTLYSKKEICIKQVKEIIIAAAVWNEEAKKNKVPMVKKKGTKIRGKR